MSSSIFEEIRQLGGWRTP